MAKNTKRSGGRAWKNERASVTSKKNLAPRVINTAEPQIVASALRQVHPNNIGALATPGKMEPKSRGIT